MKYHFCHGLLLTLDPDRANRQGLAGSLTGAVASQKVTEAPNGPLRLVGHQPHECKGRRGLDCEADTPSRDESRA